MSNISSIICGERATKCAVGAGNVRCVQRCRLCMWHQNKTVNERRGGYVCRLCNCMVKPNATVAGTVNIRSRIYCSQWGGQRSSFGWIVCFENSVEKLVRYQRYIFTVQAQWNSRKIQFHKQLKYIVVRYYFVRECYQDGRIGVEHIEGVNQLADLLTKSLDQVWIETLRYDIGVWDY